MTVGIVDTVIEIMIVMVKFMVTVLGNMFITVTVSSRRHRGAGLLVILGTEILGVAASGRGGTEIKSP